MISRLLFLAACVLVWLGRGNPGYAGEVFTTTGVQPFGEDWNREIWIHPINGSGTVPVAGNIYQVVTNESVNFSRVRSPALDGVQTFPGDQLILEANTEILAKKGPTIPNVGTLNFPGVNGQAGLVMNGGQLSAGDDAIFEINGHIEVQKACIIRTGGARAFKFTAKLTGVGPVIIAQGPTNIPTLEVIGASNRFFGNWIVKTFLKASSVGSLGYGDVLVDPKFITNSVAALEGPAFFEPMYDVPSPGSLTLTNGGVMILHQHCTFSAVTIEGMALAPGVHSYAELAANFPNSFSGGSGSLTVATIAAPPLITAQPLSRTVGRETSFALSVEATGLDLSYQWQHDGQNLPGATSPTLNLARIQDSDGGNYQAIISNAAGTVASDVATLTVIGWDPIITNMIAWWKADGDTRDSAGGHHGTLMDNAVFDGGKIGQAFRLDGTNDFVRVPDSPDWAFGLNDFTIELWAYFENTTGARAFVGSDEGGGVVTKWMFWYTGELLFSAYANPGSVQIDAPIPFATNTWHHLAVTRIGTTYCLYTNSTLVATFEDSGNVPIPDARVPFTIGCAEDNFYFDGLLDDIAIYRRGLSAGEIHAIYAAGSLGKAPQFPPLTASPQITVQPLDQITTAGQNVSFAVSASGSPALEYQWLLGGDPLPQKTNSFLLITNVQPAQ